MALLLGSRPLKRFKRSKSSSVVKRTKENCTHKLGLGAVKNHWQTWKEL
jgi:hypothetical protein